MDGVMMLMIAIILVGLDLGWLGSLAPLFEAMITA